VGYGDISIYSMNERIFALVWMIFGVGFFSFTIGNLATIIRTMDSKKAHLQDKITILSEFVRRNNLPPEVEVRIKRFIENNHTEHMQKFD
jgi:hypothetical protein